jgi:hypothetical protein
MVIESLPSRPLNEHEVDVLVDSGKFSPLTMIKMLPNDTSVQFDEIDDAGDVLEEFGVVRVYSLLHATEQRGVTIAFSEEDGEWMQVVEMTTPEFDPDALEAQTHEFVQEHMTSDVDTDLGQVPVAPDPADGGDADDE